MVNVMKGLNKSILELHSAWTGTYQLAGFRGAFRRDLLRLAVELLFLLDGDSTFH